MGDDGTYVLELSSFQLELTPSGGFDIAVLLNVTPDHLERHGGMAGYVDAKRRVFDRCAGTAVVGMDDEECRTIRDRLRTVSDVRIVPVSATTAQPGGVYVRDGTLIDDTDGKRASVTHLADIDTLPGDHNAQNAAAAYAAARAAGVARDAIVDGLRSYPGLAHRQQLVARIDGVAFVNDSKATNPEAASRALSCYDDIYWIAGGHAKEGGLDSLAPYLPRIRHAFLIGEAAESFAAQLGAHIDAQICGTLDKATRAAHDRARRESPGDAVVLLSPACASYDQYPNFEERGRDFERCVRQLPGEDRTLFAIEESGA